MSEFSSYDDLLRKANVVTARIKYLDALMTGTAEAITDARDVLYMRRDLAGAR